MQEQENAEFFPIVFESSGTMHSKAKLILEQAASVRNIPASTLYNFFLKRISVVFQRSIAEAIYKKTFIVGSHIMDLPYLLPSYSDDEVMAQSYNNNY